MEPKSDALVDSTMYIFCGLPAYVSALYTNRNQSRQNNMATINGVVGLQFVKGSKDYETRRYQYATSTYEDEHRMDPQLIIVPNNKNDISLAIKYAKAQKIAIAVRTGGHQYSGASSTSGKNIQLDLKKTFRGPDDQRFFEKDGKAFIRTSVSWSLGLFSEFLKKNKAFVPHGQCVAVHVGGHVQTGGYGQLGRSFGLFGDHVISLEIVDHAGEVKEVTKQSDPELFYGLLGGSPGNFGIITHFTINVHQDKDHIGSRGVKSIYWYDTKTLKRLLDVIVEMAENPDFPPNYDYCVSVLSSSFKLLDWFPEIDGKMRDEHPELFGDDDMPFWPRMIIVYAQWVPLKPGDSPDMKWFDRIRQGSLFNLPVKVKPMSELAGDWLFRNVREFDKPYVKRTYATNSTTLSKDGWTTWVSERIDRIVRPEANRCWISAQLQCFGGNQSRFFLNRNNGTAFSWRDSTVLCTIDCFHNPNSKSTAVDWQKINDFEGIGPKGKFSRLDKRVLWGSYGGLDLDANWRMYYEDQAKYDRLRKIRAKADPDGTFTPNAFAVKRWGT